MLSLRRLQREEPSTVKNFLALCLLAVIAVPALANDDVDARSGVDTFCTCDRNPEADWWWDGHDLVLNIVDPATGTKTRHMLDEGLSSLSMCKQALPKNPACVRL